MVWWGFTTLPMQIVGEFSSPRHWETERNTSRKDTQHPNQLQTRTDTNNKTDRHTEKAKDQILTHTNITNQNHEEIIRTTKKQCMVWWGFTTLPMRIVGEFLDPLATGRRKGIQAAKTHNTQTNSKPEHKQQDR